MVKLNICLDLADDGASYNPGQEITGSIKLELKSSMKINALKIKFRGQANVKWEEKLGDTTVHYISNENYFKVKRILLGRGAGGSNETTKLIPAGNHSFPFSFRLPRHIPSTFFGGFGQVRYHIKATIERPSLKRNHKTKVPFTVLCPLDLNEDRSLSFPLAKEESKTLCCWCCVSPPVKAELQLKKRGFVPGQNIEVNAKVENMSLRSMPRTKATLKQYIVFRCKKKATLLAIKVAKVSGQSCPARGSTSWNGKFLQVREGLTPSLLRYCNIIDIFYCVNFVVVTPFGSKNLKMQVPVAIGTIPLRDEVIVVDRSLLNSIFLRIISAQSLAREQRIDLPSRAYVNEVDTTDETAMTS